MTKSELIAKIAFKYPMLYQSDIEGIVNTILKTITESIISGNRVELRGFGTFGLKIRNSRKSRNPRTGEQIFVESKLLPYFRMGKKLKERLNK
jgi:integration host factor subunit beta